MMLPMKNARTQSSKIQTGSMHVSRRQFFRAGAIGAAAMSFPFVGRVLGANDRINVGCIGVAGKGDSDTDDTARCGGNLVALCDVDERHSEGQGARNIRRPNSTAISAKCWRKWATSIDAVTVSIPDHCHGVASALAMSMGKHVYCQKPLTQTILEARQLRDLAATKKLATQMGNQGSAQSSACAAASRSSKAGSSARCGNFTSGPIVPSGRRA